MFCFKVIKTKTFYSVVQKIKFIIIEYSIKKPLKRRMDMVIFILLLFICLRHHYRLFISAVANRSVWFRKDSVF